MLTVNFSDGTAAVTDKRPPHPQKRLYCFSRINKIIKSLIQKQSSCFSSTQHNSPPLMYKYSPFVFESTTTLLFPMRIKQRQFSLSLNWRPNPSSSCRGWQGSRSAPPSHLSACCSHGAASETSCVRVFKKTMSNASLWSKYGGLRETERFAFKPFWIFHILHSPHWTSERWVKVTGRGSVCLPLTLWSWRQWPASSGGWSPPARRTPPPAWPRAWLCSPAQEPHAKTQLERRRRRRRAESPQQHSLVVFSAFPSLQEALVDCRRGWQKS